MKHEILGDLVELLQLRGDDAGAVRRHADGAVLLEDEDIASTPRETQSREQSRRTCSDDDDVMNGGARSLDGRHRQRNERVSSTRTRPSKPLSPVTKLRFLEYIT